MASTSQKLDALLKERGKGARALARLVPIPAATINRYILDGDNAKWTVPQIEDIATALEVHVNALLPDSLLELQKRPGAR